MIIAIIVLAVIVLYLIGFFNGQQTIEVQINASIQEIGNQLKRQAQLIPSLVDSVKGYLKHEKSIFEQLTSVRKSIDNAVKSNDGAKIDEAQSMINKVLGSLKVIVESNPQLQSAGVVTDLMNELRDTADKVMFSRRTLIDLSASYNIRISTIPGLWLAPLFGFKKKVGLDTPVSGDFLSVTASETSAPKTDLS